MPLDNPTTLCTWAQFESGAFADLARGYTNPAAQTELLVEATRLCEQLTERRLVPFTGMTETHRATGGDPDEYPAAGVPMSQAASLGQSYARALGDVGDSVRHVWLHEHAARYPEMWAYTGVSAQVITTYGGSTAVSVTGPEPDSGHIWLSLGSWVPPGSLIRFVYGGGYTTIPADLVRAGKLMTASLIMRELQPNKLTRDPQGLWGDAVMALAGYSRD